MRWSFGGGEAEEGRRRAPELAAALAVAGIAVHAALTYAPLADWASRPAEWLPGWGSYAGHEEGDRRFVLNLGDGGWQVPLRAGQEVVIDWEAMALSGGTLRLTLFGAGTSCGAAVATLGAGTATLRVAESGLYRFHAHGSATSRIGDGHRFVGAPPPGYVATSRASWGPLPERRRRELAQRRPTDRVVEVACVARW